MTKLKKSKLKEPYKSHPYFMVHRTSFPKRNSAGVYLIYKNDVLRYVGFSRSDVYKSLYRHFQKWNDRKQQRVVYENKTGIKVRVIYCNTGANADRLEKALIIKLKPKDNIDKYWITNEIDEKEKAIYNNYLMQDTQEIFINEIETPF